MDSKPNFKLDVVVPAAGVGRRMGAAVPKQYLKLLDKTILEQTVSKLLSCPEVNQVVVALSPDDGIFDSLPLHESSRVCRVNGGAERADSVLAGLLACHTEWVLVHDAARPLVTAGDISKLIAVCLGTGCGGILAAPAADTLKLIQKPQPVCGNFHEQQEQLEQQELQTRPDLQAKALTPKLLIERTLPRELIYRAQTPQCFKRTQLIAALQSARERGITITDEASAMEAAGHPCQIVCGRSDNFKITTPEDLQLAQALVSFRTN